ncbi:MAG TPA: MFS transporter, partial [Acidimicrobiales bacterium]|nr:MFS transporter [Acidimicrobiales bacterium]
GLGVALGFCHTYEVGWRQRALESTARCTLGRVPALLPWARRWALYPYLLHPPEITGGGGEAGQAGVSANNEGPSAGMAPARHRWSLGDLAPFTRLAVVHGLSSAGDGMVAVALAGSVFFNVSVRAAQWRVELGLALSVAPFAIVGPLLGPLVERVRGGRRAIVMLSGAGRSVCCFFMAIWSRSLLLFPVAFFTLVFSKLYLVARAALVPSAVDGPEDLVRANSKLAIGGSVAGLAAGSFGAAVFELFGGRSLLRLDIVVYLACAWGATQLRPAPARGRESRALLPAAPAPPAPPSLATPALGLPPGGIQLAALATGGLRAATGFVTFLLVFTFRREEAGLIWYGLALGASQVGNVAGALLAPKVRQRLREEWMLTGASLVVGAGAISAGLVRWGRHWAVAVLLVAGIAFAAGSGKLAFDSMVQRDVPSRVRARSFARFESAFQLSWAIGGLLAVVVPMSLSVGFVSIGIVGVLGSAAFAGGSVKARRGTLPAWWPGSAPHPPSTSTRRSLPGGL